MRYRQLGRSGLTVSMVGLGCARFGSTRSVDRQTAVEMVREAIDLGITLFDTAASYGEGESEEFVGAAVKGRRNEVILATKFGGPRAKRPDIALGSRGSIRGAVEDSLRRLQTDYIDLYQMHIPDPATPIHETLSVLDDLVGEGKVRYVGSSNVAAWQIVEAEWTARTEHLSRFISVQNRYSLLERSIEDEVVPVCLAHGIGILPFAPLARGVLAGRRGGDTTDSRLRPRPAPDGPTLDVLDALERYAAERSASLLQVAIAGLAARPGVGSVIAGASRLEQVQANARAIEWDPGPSDLEALEGILASAPPSP